MSRHGCLMGWLGGCPSLFLGGGRVVLRGCYSDCKKDSALQFKEFRRANPHIFQKRGPSREHRDSWVFFPSMESTLLWRSVRPRPSWGSSLVLLRNLGVDSFSFNSILFPSQLFFTNY